MRSLDTAPMCPPPGMTAAMRAASSNKRARTPQQITPRGVRRTFARRTLLPALLLACAACGESAADDAGPAITRRDSAGIAIVEVPPSVLAALPVERVAAEAAFTVGVVEGRDEEMFAEDGTLLDSRTVSGGIGVQLGLWHHRPGRWTWPHVFQVTENAYPRDVPEGDGPHGILQVMGRYDTLSGMRFDTVASAPGYFVRLGAEERAAATEEGLTHYAISNVAPHPLAPTAHAAFLVDRPVTGWSGSAEVRIHDDEGVTQRIIRFEPSGPLMAPDDARFRTWAVSFHDRGHRPIMRRAWNVLEPPSEPARFHDLRTYGADDIWIAIAPEEVESDARLWTRWLRVSADGTPRGWLIAPPVEILDLTPEALVALERDELDVPRVAVYRFRNAL